jgi:hypothetical protein
MMRKGKCYKTAMRTAYPMAGRRLKEDSARDVVPVRQKDCSKVDYCNCPRHMPHLWN